MLTGHLNIFSGEKFSQIFGLLKKYLMDSFFFFLKNSFRFIEKLSRKHHLFQKVMKVESQDVAFSARLLSLGNVYSMTPPPLFAHFKIGMLIYLSYHFSSLQGCGLVVGAGSWTLPALLLSSQEHSGKRG